MPWLSINEDVFWKVTLVDSNSFTFVFFYSNMPKHRNCVDHFVWYKYIEYVALWNEICKSVHTIYHYFYICMLRRVHSLSFSLSLYLSQHIQSWFPPKHLHYIFQTWFITTYTSLLVGGWTTLLKNMLVKMGSSSPSFGVKIPKHIWNHHHHHKWRFIGIPY